MLSEIEINLVILRHHSMRKCKKTFCNFTIVFSDIEPKLLMKTSQLTSVGLPENIKSLTISP